MRHDGNVKYELGMIMYDQFEARIYICRPEETIMLHRESHQGACNLDSGKHRGQILMASARCCKDLDGQVASTSSTSQLSFQQSQSFQLKAKQPD